MYTADLAITNARIMTMEPGRPEAEAALVRGGRIAAVGTTREVTAAGRGAPVLDCGGKTVVPGFIDAHCHLEMTCLALERCVQVHTPPMTSLTEIAKALRTAAAETPAGRWVIGRGSFALASKVQEGRLFTREELDAVSTRHPVIVYSGFHVAMLNTVAFKELGLWGRVSNPPGGVFIHGDPLGRPTGVATEVWDMLPPFSLEETRQALRKRVVDLFVSQGVTSAYTIPFAGHDVRAIQELQAAGDFPLRIRTYYHVPKLMSLDAVLATGLQSGFGNDMLRFGGVKIFVNGISNDGLGNPWPDYKRSQEELNAFVTRAYDGGVQLMMHATGAASAIVGANAIEAAVGEVSVPPYPRLEHAGDARHTPENRRRYKDLGIGMVTTPQFIYASGAARARTGGGPQLRTLLDEGFEVIGCSDSTGTVPDGIAPMFNVACAVARLTHEGKALNPEEAVTAEEAIGMFTLSAARSGMEGQDKGSIAVGKLGDFAVLSADPRKAGPDDLYKVKVDATVLGGEVVFRRGAA